MKVGAIQIFGGVILLLSAAIHGQNHVDVSAFGERGRQCANLRAMDFSLIEDAPTEITAAAPVKSSGATPNTCVVEGTVWRNVRVRVEFPLSGWNGKMLVVGSGGQAGRIVTPEIYERIKWIRRPLLPQGYAFVGHDSGHSAAGTKWGWHNPSAKIDYGFRGGHVTSLIGKAILRAFFGRMPSRAYYHGCSNGGREALTMAQRYPWDFDGIIAGAPSLAYSSFVVRFYVFVELVMNRGRNGFDRHAANVLHQSILEQCDAIDGMKDGILEDPRKCKIDFNRTLCGREVAENCLTPHQVSIARQIYDGPRQSIGSLIAPSSVMPVLS